MTQPFDTIATLHDSKLYILDNETYDVKICTPDKDGVYNLDDAESVPQQALYDMSANEYELYCEIQNKLIKVYEQE